MHSWVSKVSYNLAIRTYRNSAHRSTELVSDRHLIATMTPAPVCAVHPPRSRSLDRSSASEQNTKGSKRTCLDAWLPRHTTLQLHHRTAHLITHARLATMVLSRCCSVMSLVIRGHWTSTSVAMVTKSIWMGCRRLGSLVTSRDGVFGVFCYYFGFTMRRSTTEALYDARFPGCRCVFSCHYCLR